MDRAQHAVMVTGRKISSLSDVQDFDMAEQTLELNGEPCRKILSVATGQPSVRWTATVWLHTVHQPATRALHTDTHTLILTQTHIHTGKHRHLVWGVRVEKPSVLALVLKYFQPFMGQALSGHFLGGSTITKITPIRQAHTCG